MKLFTCLMHWENSYEQKFKTTALLWSWTAKGHINDNLSLAISPGRSFVIIGVTGEQPRCSFGNDLIARLVLNSIFPKGAPGASSISFNKYSTLVAITIDDNDNCFYVYDMLQSTPLNWS
eukprot:TRINITY_DN15632_c0_g2_i2.p1 TRINITY_DN15632_c0_g2~~TRINITY_DN15632_c0_g2_i2.p1  ORF type:complete len:120 (-),score=10.26 TRINITY_DN15632_c0_g2_i2:554-913(-)